MAKAGTVHEKSWGKLGGASGQMHKFEPTGTQEADRTSQEPQGGSRRGIEAKGGNNKAFYSSGAHNTDYAGQQKPETSGPTKEGGNHKFAEGGTTKMFGNRGSMRAEGGKSSPP